MKEISKLPFFLDLMKLRLDFNLKAKTPVEKIWQLRDLYEVTIMFISSIMLGKWKEEIEKKGKMEENDRKIAETLLKYSGIFLGDWVSFLNLLKEPESISNFLDEKIDKKSIYSILSSIPEWRNQFFCHSFFKEQNIYEKEFEEKYKTINKILDLFIEDFKDYDLYLEKDKPLKVEIKDPFTLKISSKDFWEEVKKAEEAGEKKDIIWKGKDEEINLSPFLEIIEYEGFLFPSIYSKSKKDLGYFLEVLTSKLIKKKVIYFEELRKRANLKEEEIGKILDFTGVIEILSKDIPKEKVEVALKNIIKEEEEYIKIGYLDEEFKKILKERKNTYLIGPGGVGKTRFVENLSKELREAGEITFYYDLRFGEGKVEQFFSSLPFQIAKYRDIFYNFSKFPREEKEFPQFLKEITKFVGIRKKVIWIFDGAESIKEVKGSVFDLFEKNIKEKPENQIIIITGREGEVEESVEDCIKKYTEELNFLKESEEYKKILKIYIEKKLPKIEEKEELIEKSKRTFLYLRHYIDVLGDAYELEKLPQPEEFYNDYFNKIKGVTGVYFERYEKIFSITSIGEEIGGLPLSFYEELGIPIDFVLETIARFESFFYLDRNNLRLKLVHNDFIDFIKKDIKEELLFEFSKKSSELFKRKDIIKEEQIIYVLCNLNKIKGLKIKEFFNVKEEIYKLFLNFQEEKEYYKSYGLAMLIFLIADYQIRTEGEDEKNLSELAGAYNSRGNAKNNLQDFNGAIEDYNRAIKIYEKLYEEGKEWVENGLARAYYNRGIAKAGLQDFNGAIEDYNRAIKIYEKLYEEGKEWVENNLARAYNNRGIAKAELQDFSGAIEDFYKAIVIYYKLYEEGKEWVENKLAGVYYNRGITKRNLQNFNGAIEDYNRAIKIYEKLYKEGKEWVANELASAYNNRGNAKRNLQDFNGAIEDYNRAIGIREKLYEKGKEWVENMLAKCYLFIAYAYKENKNKEMPMIYSEKFFLLSKTARLKKIFLNFAEKIFLKIKFLLLKILNIIFYFQILIAK